MHVLEMNPITLDGRLFHLDSRSIEMHIPLTGYERSSNGRNNHRNPWKRIRAERTCILKKKAITTFRCFEFFLLSINRFLDV